MPFARRTTLPNNPSVRIFFIGLNILAPSANDTCQVFVHNSSDPPHKLSIETRRKRPGKPDVLLMRHLGPLHPTGADPTRSHGLLIRTSGLGGARRVEAYDGTVASNEGTSLFDAFSLERLLGAPPAVSPFGGMPSISIDNGVLYTADKVTVQARLIKVVGGGEIARFAEVATIIGANIYLDPAIPAHKVNLFWRQQGRDVRRELKPSANFTYEIYVVNEPLFEEDAPTVPRHGEFTEYFRILPEVPREQQFEIEFLQDIPDRGSNRTPCMSILLGD